MTATEIDSLRNATSNSDRPASTRLRTDITMHAVRNMPIRIRGVTSFAAYGHCVSIL